MNQYGYNRLLSTFLQGSPLASTSTTINNTTNTNTNTNNTNTRG